MGDKLKYKKGDVLVNGKGKLYGTIVKVEKSEDISNKTNKYDIELLDGTLVPLLEHNVIETDHHKEKAI